MAPLRSALHARRRPATAAQGGYALLTVLAVIAFTALVITALMAMAMTTMRVSSNSAQAARELRALDGAMDAAINQMRFDPDSLGGACSVLPPVERIQEMTFRQGSAPDVVVEFDPPCEAVGASAHATADQLRLVAGQGYLGEIPWTTDCPGGDPGPGCMPWSAAAGSVPADLASSNPNLVHVGNEALQLDSGVTVRNGAAVLRNPTSDSPAVSVAGEYTQGSPGLDGTAEIPCGLLSATEPTGAGLLVDRSGDDEPECDSQDARDVETTLTEPVAGFSIHPNDNPFVPFGSCVRSVIDLRPGRYDQARTDVLNQFLDQNAPGARGNCGTRKTFHFHPGVYYFDAEEIVFDRPDAYFVLGRPLDWIPYLVDATDSEATQVRHPMVAGLDSAAASAIAGVRNSSAVRNPQAQLCDEEQSGVTFVLSPRTSIEHRSGRFAMCPAFSPVEGQPPLPAIYQETSTPIGFEVEQSPLTRTFDCNPANQHTRDIVEFGHVGSRGGERFQVPAVPSGQCRNARTHTVTLSARNAAPLDSARVLITGYENKSTPSNLITDRFTVISVIGADNRRICTTAAQRGLANGEWSNSVDLLTGSCVDPRSSPTSPDPRFPDNILLPQVQPLSRYYTQEAALTHESQLDGARLEITQYMTFLTSLLPLTQRATIEDVAVVTNSAIGSVQPSDVVPGDPAAGTWEPGEAVAGHDGLAVPTMPGGCEYHIVCEVTVPGGASPARPFVHEMVLQDLALDPDALEPYLQNDIDPNIHALRVLVRLDPMHCPASPTGRCQFPAVDPWVEDSYFGDETTFRLELATDTGTRCMQTRGYVNSAQELAFDLSDNDIDPAIDPAECSAALTNFSELSGADLTLRVEMPCVRNWLQNIPWQCASTGSGVLQVRPPAIQQIRLEAETDSFVGLRPRSDVTIDATTADVGSSFNVIGKVWMPRANLDVHWNGDVTEGRPLVSDELVLGSLGSTILPGATPTRANHADYTDEDRYVVCCEERLAETRHVRLTARTGERKLQVDVLFTDVVADPEGGPSVYSPGHKVEILDWQTCDAGRCDTG